MTACTNEPKKIQLFADVKNLNRELAEKVEILYTDSAKTKARVTAPIVVRVTLGESYTEMPKGLLARFYDSREHQNAFLKADYGKRYTLSQMMEVKGRVLVVNEKGDSLNTEKLIWYENQDRLYTDEPVRIKTKDEIIYGDGLESNQDFSRYRILNVKGVVSLK
jgi:LPS export ABC transporter protein LptC